MGDAIKREATCTCGDLRLLMCGEPALVSSCCCTRCQRRTGAFFGVTVYFRPEQMTARSGAETLYRRPSDDGEALFHFCTRCGSTVWWELAGDDSVIGVAGGCFADPALPGPQRMVFTSTRHPFVRTPEGLPTFRDGPD